MPIYMGFFDKPDVLSRSIRGDVKAKGFEGWIELQSAQLGTHRSVTNSGSSRVGEPSPSEILVTKNLDSASSALFKEALHGNAKLVVIAFVKDDVAYLTLVLYGTLIANYATSGHGGADRTSPMESLSLNFNSIRYNTKDKAPDVTRQSLRQLHETAGHPPV